MLLKWLFIFFAVLWLYQALRPFFMIRPPAPPPPTPPKAPEPGSRNVQTNDPDDGEYIDYEEVK